MNVRIEYVTHPTPDFISLVTLLDEELHVKNGDLQKTYDHFNQLAGITDFFIAYDEDIPIGSAAMKPYDATTDEVKRVFVKREYCGNGVSMLLMKKREIFNS
jgi:putative acetyltransferase